MDDVEGWYFALEGRYDIFQHLSPQMLNISQAEIVAMLRSQNIRFRPIAGGQRVRTFPVPGSPYEVVHGALPVLQVAPRSDLLFGWRTMVATLPETEVEVRTFHGCLQCWKDMKPEHLLEQLSQTTTAHILLLFDAELPKSLDSYGLSQLVRKEVTLIGGGRISSFKFFQYDRRMRSFAPGTPQFSIGTRTSRWIVEDREHALSGELYEGRVDKFGDPVASGPPSAFMSTWAIAQTLEKNSRSDNNESVKSVWWLSVLVIAEDCRSSLAVISAVLSTFVSLIARMRENREVAPSMIVIHPPGIRDILLAGRIRMSSRRCSNHWAIVLLKGRMRSAP